MTSLVDNDIVLKVSCYGLVDEILLPVCESIELAGVLGTMKFVVSRRIRRLGLNGGPDEAIACLESLLERIAVIEPTDEEQRMAADFELNAQRAGVSLDAGESQLCALAVTRSIPRLLTGDKRAIAGLDVLLEQDQRLSELCGKLYCLEHLVSKALSADSAGTIRNAICAQGAVDKTLAICFSCRNEPQPEVTAQCLESYMRDLRIGALRILAT